MAAPRLIASTKTRLGLFWNVEELVLRPAQISFRLTHGVLAGASEWALLVPCLGMPKPIIVLIRISEGLSFTFCAFLMACSIALEIVSVFDH
jgi:hypothetical protein